MPPRWRESPRARREPARRPWPQERHRRRRFHRPHEPPMNAAAAPMDLVALAADIARRVGVKAERAAPLGRYTTMRVGGPADLFTTAHNAFELRALVRFARSRDLPLTLL